MEPSGSVMDLGDARRSRTVDEEGAAAAGAALAGVIFSSCRRGRRWRGAPFTA